MQLTGAAEGEEGSWSRSIEDEAFPNLLWQSSQSKSFLQNNHAVIFHELKTIIIILLFLDFRTNWRVERMVGCCINCPYPLRCCVKSWSQKYGWSLRAHGAHEVLPGKAKYILWEMMYKMWSARNMCMLLMQAIVTEEDGMESIAHRFLSAAVKVRLKCILSVGLVHF